MFIAVTLSARYVIKIYHTAMQNYVFISIFHDVTVKLFITKIYLKHKKVFEIFLVYCMLHI